MADFKLFTSIRYDPVLCNVTKHENLKPTDWNHRVASPWYMLDYHRDRMLRAATHFGWQEAVQTLEGLHGLKRLDDFLRPFAKEAGLNPHRVKILLDRDGSLSHESGPAKQTGLGNLFPDLLPNPSLFSPPRQTDGAHGEEAAKERAMAPLEHPEYHVMVDGEPTSHTEYTHYKTTKRQMYDDARKRHALEPTDLKEVLLVNPSDNSVMEATITTPYFWQGGRWVTPPVSQGFRAGEGSGGNDGTTRRWALERGLAVEEIVLADSLKDGEQCWLSNGVRGFIFGRIKR